MKLKIFCDPPASGTEQVRAFTHDPRRNIMQTKRKTPEIHQAAVCAAASSEPDAALTHCMLAATFKFATAEDNQKKAKRLVD